MQQVMTAVSAHKPPVHPPPAAATVADVTRPPVTTVNPACDEDWCRILSQSLVLLLWAGHSGSGSSCHPRLVSQARSAVGWSGSCLRS